MSGANDDQKAFWERFATLWVENQRALDTLMAPVLDGVLMRADLRPGDRVLDIGCGTGTSTLQAADLVGAEGYIEGVDISEPMLDRARAAGREQANVSFSTADAAAHQFDPASFDAAISRFGVMFFADPVTAFGNIRRAMKPGARITMASWSALNANPWFQVPMYAAKRQLGVPPHVDPDAPGPLAFRSIERVVGILTDAGFEQASGTEEQLLLTPPGDGRTVARHAASIGPAARTMEHFEGTDEDFEAIAADVEQTFRQYETQDGWRVPATINFFTAVAR